MLFDSVCGYHYRFQARTIHSNKMEITALKLFTSCSCFEIRCDSRTIEKALYFDLALSALYRERSKHFKKSRANLKPEKIAGYFCRL